MSPPPQTPPLSPLVLDETGQPRSRLYGDVYFSTADGLAESRAVFLGGCDLPEAWAGRTAFTVAELGFGTGLNILALIDLWRRRGPADGHLHIFSVEGHPVDREGAERVLAAWPELAEVTQPLLAAWPGMARGFHRVELPQFRVILDLAVLEVGEALAAWSGRADAWFLDGFSPAVNPQMWRPEVLQRVAERSAPGARLATFTVAGAVRRGLQAAGFEVEKRPGFGRKRERLVGRFPMATLTTKPAVRRVAVIGGGIAGAAVARALSVLSVTPIVHDAQGSGAGASGNPAALVTARLDAGLGPVAGLFAQALRRAGDLYQQLDGAVIDQGVLQLAVQPRDGPRFEKISASDLFGPGALSLFESPEASAWLGADAAGGLAQHEALVVRPRSILDAWLGEVRPAAIAGLTPVDGGWRLQDAEGCEIDRVDAVVVCAGPGLAALSDLPLQPVRGQITFAPGAPAQKAVAWGGYLAPAPGGLVFGATHDRDDAGGDERPEDHQRNLATLAQAHPALAASLAGPFSGRASVRAVTPDRLPVAGEIAQGLWVLGGLGSRGFCLAPLLAEHVAAGLTGAPSPMPRAFAEVVDPSRFARRAARRGGGTRAGSA
ncbi:MAG: tRNA (5-methylaminomethyl-2-thiouridine)(34)-methyltransferase MnmD [Pseudomonadota bacterium]